MDAPVDLPRVRQALAVLDRLAAEHPERLHQGEPWNAHLGALEEILVAEPHADRMDGGMEGKEGEERARFEAE